MVDFSRDIYDVRQRGLFRRLVEVKSPTGPVVRIGGREMLMLASNDYLGLAAHPRIISCAQRAASAWGAGAGASRLMSGNIGLYETLERDIAAFKGTEDALVFSTGYMANMGILTAVAEEQDIIYSDALNHASIVDGCRMSRARVVVYPHRDTAALEGHLRSSGPCRRKIIITDSVFSMDGDIAPLDELAVLADAYDALLVVDDAHGSGVLGQRGRGALEHFGIPWTERVVVMGTMGKALGCFGAFVAGSATLKTLLINRARSFMFTTALPPSVIASAQEAVRVVEGEPERRSRLGGHVRFMRSGLQRLGFDTGGSETQIIPLIIGGSEPAGEMAERLFEENIFCPSIRPPAVPEHACRLRLSLMASHRREDLERALGSFEKAGRHIGVI